MHLIEYYYVMYIITRYSCIILIVYLMNEGVEHVKKYALTIDKCLTMIMCLTTSLYHRRVDIYRQEPIKKGA